MSYEQGKLKSINFKQEKKRGWSNEHKTMYEEKKQAKHNYSWIPSVQLCF